MKNGNAKNVEERSVLTVDFALNVIYCKVIMFVKNAYGFNI